MTLAKPDYGFLKKLLAHFEGNAIRVAYEAGPGGFDLYDRLTADGREDTIYLRLGSHSTNICQSQGIRQVNRVFSTILLIMVLNWLIQAIVGTGGKWSIGLAYSCSPCTRSKPRDVGMRSGR